MKAHHAELLIDAFERFFDAKIAAAKNPYSDSLKCDVESRRASLITLIQNTVADQHALTKLASDVCISLNPK